MQLVNGAQFLNITFLLVLFAAAAVTAVLLTVIFPLTSIYVSLQSRKLDLSIVVLSLTCLSEEYSTLTLSRISTQILVLNLYGLFDSSFNKFAIFWYPVIILLHQL